MLVQAQCIIEVCTGPGETKDTLQFAVFRGFPLSAGMKVKGIHIDKG